MREEIKKRLIEIAERSEDFEEFKSNADKTVRKLLQVYTEREVELTLTSVWEDLQQVF